MNRSPFLLALLFVPGIASAQDKLPPRVVRVVGTAEVRVVPDQARIELGVEKQNVNATSAKQAADATARQILATLRAHSIDAKDVQTTFLSLQPQFNYRKGMRISYFVASQTMTVTVRDLPKLDALLGSLIKAGGNRIDAIQYDVTDLRKYRDQARDLAMRAAREKAAALAKAVGQEIGDAYSIDELPESTYAYGGFLANTATLDVTKTRAPSGPTTAPGQNKVSASVVVAFDLK